MQLSKKATAALWHIGSANNRVSKFSGCSGEALRRLLLFPALRIVTPVIVDGVEHIQGNGPYIFAANHASHLDTPVLLAALPARLRLRVRVAAAADYFFTSWWRGACVSLLLNAFPFERHGPGCEASLLRTQQFLAAGHSVIIFPEGTRAKEGQIQRFKRGVGTLAHTEGVQVIPTWIGGTCTALPKGARWPRRQRVTVRLGAPLDLSGEVDPFSAAAEIEQHVRVLSRQMISS